MASSSKKGYLRYKCDCGALIKVETNDLYHALYYNLAASSRPQLHQCTATHVGLAHLIGGTYEEEQAPV